MTSTCKDENCYPTEKILFTFYPDATWNSTLIRCISTNIGSGDRAMSANSTIMLQTACMFFFLIEGLKNYLLSLHVCKSMTPSEQITINT